MDTENHWKEKYGITIRPMTEPERMYAYTQSQQIMGQTGCIGHLRADMDTNGIGFFSSWDDHCGNLKTPEFKTEFDTVINAFRKDFLANRSTLSKYCYAHPESAYPDSDLNEFGFRADTAAFSYMMRLNPNQGAYNLYCYCYRRDWLDEHLTKAENGIRFIDPQYRELFRLPDGGTIKVVAEDDTSVRHTCRYIDPPHHTVDREIIHICEIAEQEEKNNKTVMPVTPVMDITHKHKNDYER